MTASPSQTDLSDTVLALPDEEPAIPTREYIRVQPSTTPLTPQTIESHVRRLHHFSNKATSPGFFTGDLYPPLIEIVLVSDGREDSTLDYCFGFEKEDHLDQFEGILRGLFPNTFGFKRTDWHPDLLLDSLRTRPTPRENTEERTLHIATLEYTSVLERPNDWQTRLTTFAPFTRRDEGDPPRVPLNAVVETMATTSVPIIYQVLCRPRPDWSRDAAHRAARLRANLDTPGQEASDWVFNGSSSGSTPISQSNSERLEELLSKDARSCYDVNVRALAIASSEDDEPLARHVIEELRTALAPVGKTSYQLDGAISTDDTTHGARIVEAVRNRKFRKKGSRLNRLLPGKTKRPVIVADPHEVPNFILLGGDGLTAEAARRLAPTPGEQTPLVGPPAAQLATYKTDGLTLGYLLSQDDLPLDITISLSPELQALHALINGKTGSGKTMLLINAILDNHAATEGPDILIDPKGDGMAMDYLLAHYARFGTLDDVRYFDCSSLLPAFSFFDIRDELAAGVSRSTAVEDKVEHYVEILRHLMGRERFDQATLSADVIRDLVKALFDPVNGDDVYTNRDLHEEALLMHEHRTPPPVSEADLEQSLASHTVYQNEAFDNIMGGAARRIDKITSSTHLKTIFNHVHDGTEPHFDLMDWLDEDVVIIFDMGPLRNEPQQALSLVILSNLWTALRRRKARDPGPHPLVNPYLEEAASIAVSEIVSDLLAQGRGFDTSLTLSMQFPAQLEAASEKAYQEVLNNVSTYVTGNVPIDRHLAERLATDDMSPAEVGNRLRALRRGQWLVSLPAEFGAPEPRPFLVSSREIPPGHPDGEAPLSDADRLRFDRRLEGQIEHTTATIGLTPSAEPAQRAEDDDPDPGVVHVDSALPHTRRLPTCIWYDPEGHMLRCLSCDTRFNADFEGLLQAIECHSSLERTDRDDIPICDLNLKLTVDERNELECTDHQLMFLQAVYNATQLRYDPLEYDITTDSMLRLQEYVGIEKSEIQALIEADLLRHDTDHPHRMYSVSPEGRKLIGESYREGVDYGHGMGDLEESTEHVFAIEIAKKLLEAAYLENPDSLAVELSPYHELDERHRLDLAALDEDGNVVVAVEVERVNHDLRRAAPEDYDKMASCQPEEAIWIVMSRADGHKVLDALNHPLDGKPRVAKSYASTTPPQQFSIESPGLTAMYPAEYVRDTLLKESP